MMNGKKDNGEESTFEWDDEALKRIEKVPQGFMRNMTKKRIEKYASEIGAVTITIEVAEKGLEGAKSTMGSMMGGMGGMMGKMMGKMGGMGKPGGMGEMGKMTGKPGAMGDMGKMMAKMAEMGGMPPVEPTENKKPESVPETGVEIDDNVEYYYCDICGYTVKAYTPDECPVCRSTKEKFKLVENKAEFVTASSGRVLDWTLDALERLNITPEGFMRDMTKWRIEAFTRKHGSSEVTVDLIEKKYEQWGEGSKKISRELEWDDEAKEKVEKIPSAVRGMVIKEVENEAKRSGASTVTSDILAKVRNKWSSSMEFHSDLQDI